MSGRLLVLFFVSASLACDVENASQCRRICTLGDEVTIDPQCLSNCLNYYCPEGLPSSSSVAAPEPGEAPFFDLGAFMFGFGAITACYAASLPVRVVLRLLRSTTKV